MSDQKIPQGAPCVICGSDRLEDHMLVEQEDHLGREQAGYVCAFTCTGCGEQYDVADKYGSKEMPLCEECYGESQEPPDYSDPYYEEQGYLADGTRFADPGGGSALRAASENNPRNLPCPTCGEPNRLTPADRANHYQCDACANAAERGY